MVEGVKHVRTLGVAEDDMRDQYADGKAADAWELLLGNQESRTQHYKKFLINLLHSKGCKRVLDVACGTGVDSIMLLEEGFEVVSVDASDKMLKYALQVRWNRRKEAAFDQWIIEEANWLTLYEDIEHLVGNGFDAVLCLGNSFAHMIDTFGDQREQIKAIANFEMCVKPGGLLFIDHRNYDSIIQSGTCPNNTIYYNPDTMSDIKASVLYVSGKPALVTLDYYIDTRAKNTQRNEKTKGSVSEFKLYYYPHQLQIFTDMLKDAFSSKSKHKVYGDFKDIKDVENPAFYIHIMEKGADI